MNTIKGFKVTNPDYTCRGFKYEIGKTYEMDTKPICCDRGFHFCLKAVDCFNYYTFDSKNKVVEVEALGIIDYGDDDAKCSTNKIKIVSELKWHEVLEKVNTGTNNTGYANSGDKNSGNKNSGDWNSGDKNSGGWNSGDKNSGNKNSGNKNSGDWNSGGWNSGNKNSGDGNSGNWNSGGWNSGDKNSGDWNSGNWNSGNWNTGDFNLSSCNSGCFNIEDHKVRFFDRDSSVTFWQWRGSEPYRLFNNIKTARWIALEKMSEEEKKNNPSYDICGGYLKTINFTEACQAWWGELTPKEREIIITKTPNFNAEKFSKITGITVAEIK